MVDKVHNVLPVIGKKKKRDREFRNESGFKRRKIVISAFYSVTLKGLEEI